MLKKTVLQYFDNCVSDVAVAMNCSAAAVSQWNEIIPERAALKLERITDGKLVYDESLYRKTA